jgi:hypothetical protein
MIALIALIVFIGVLLLDGPSLILAGEEAEPAGRAVRSRRPVIVRFAGRMAVPSVLLRFLASGFSPGEPLRA